MAATGKKDDRETRQRGRPRGGSRPSLPDDLLRAMRECLEERTHAEITLREVAERAGTSQEMIRYYFGSKDGLLIALVRQTSDRFMRELARLENDILERGGNPTRHLVATVLELYFTERHVSRVPALEFPRARSVIRDEILVGRAEVVVSGIHRIIRRLVEAGVYQAGLDTRKMAVTIMTMISGPVTALSALSGSWVTAEEIAGDSWVDHLTRMVDRCCRPPAA